MNCDQGSRIIIVPAGCLGHREIDLQCKSPLESVYYQFSMVNRLSPSDAISCVSAQPSDETLSVDRITVSGQTFRARISGGTMNTKTGIRFLVTTRANEEREFVVTLPIMPEGIMGSGEAGNYVLGDTGPQGPQGCAATVTVGKVLSTEPDGDPKIVNSGTEVDAVLDFTLPRGQVGPQGEQGQAATVKLGNVVTGAAGSDAAVENRGDEHNAVLDFTIPEGRQGIQGIQGKAGTQILLSNRDPVARDAKENIVWLNDVTGDLFETVSRGEDAYSWHKSGNLKGEAGSIIYTGTVDPVYNEVYKKSDLYFNITNSNLFTFNDNQWVRLANLKGDQGERGSLWFFAQEDPVTSSSYRVGDSFLNTASNDLFVFNGTNWQKVGNLQGKQGDTGPQGLQGDTGPQGLQGIQGEKGEAGKDGRDGFDGTRIITSQQDPDQGSAPLNPNVVWINTTSWEVKRTIPHGDSWDWVSLGSIRGPRGDTGPQGLQGLQGEKGAKGDDGSRWYSGHNLPDATIGLNDPRGMPRAGDQYLYLDEKTGEASAYIYTNDKTWGGPLGKVAGPQGKAATVRVVEQVRPLRPDEAATIKNIGDEHDAILQFSIPKGEKGDVGPIGKEGAAATIRIGTVTTTDPDVQASVRNSGSENTAVLEFSIPKGEKGDSYTNDGSTELNVKSIQSDGGKVGTDGAGKLSAEMLDYTIKVPTPSHQDASLGKVVD
ncbi:collagen-like protein, partial [Commensalibacter melissae]|nr:collagen-like protein [Commensalibacter melissae]